MATRKIGNVLKDSLDICVRKDTVFEFIGTISSGGVPVDLTGKTISGLFLAFALTAVIDPDQVTNTGKYTVTIDLTMTAAADSGSWYLNLIDSGDPHPLQGGEAIVEAL